jgi:DeoR/GlpR family transcriptional regulator of sugar metabolism
MENQMKDINENNLSKLYKYLQIGGRYTTKELSEKFSLSTRTIQSYLKIFKEEYGLKKEKKYYYFSDTYRHIDIDEKLQMSTALMISLYKNAIPIIEDNILENFKEIPKETDAFFVRY